MSNSQFDERNLLVQSNSWQVADGVGLLTVATLAGNSRWDALFLANLDTVAHVYSVRIAPPTGPVVVLASGSVPAAVAGVASVVEVIHAMLPVGAQFLTLPPSTSIYAELAVAVTGNDLFTSLALGGSI
jgi:hypothetical protein